MSKAILFDLDGTLLPMDTGYFVEHYMKALAVKVAPIIEPKQFTKALWEATHEVMTNTDPERLNMEVFEEAFLRLTTLKKEQIWPVFDTFYAESFPDLVQHSQPSPVAQLVIKEAVEAGYKVAIATNPIFPKVAIEHRMKWAGVLDAPFAKVTVYEESHFTKPHLPYYQAICDDIQVHPEDCIMVGNDMQEDMIASQLGVKTYLVEGNVIDRGEPQFPINDRGSLSDLLDKLKGREGIFSAD
ncbi:HAD family hydrolase [Bacillus horti]|uniref:FMN phosphatase YigB (HAD superfamily) n=1 Tax=Caldalkalibacillus horti TaxID=77523 RepID=A0ABT9W007_9BACI|nr:HAD family hydrolase [Bacillus horti]MDQ0166584.1 FMN phosphatase YigB (HAD superfamily) [Bacillus horti]